MPLLNFLSVILLIVLTNFSCQKESSTVTNTDTQVQINKGYKALFLWNSCGLPILKVTYKFEDIFKKVYPSLQLDTNQLIGSSYEDSLKSYFLTHPNFNVDDTLVFDWRLPTKEEYTMHGIVILMG